MEYDKEMGVRLHDLRTRQNLTQVEVAKKLGVSQQSVGTWENGTAIPRADALAKAARLYGTTSDYILGIDSGKWAKLEKRVERLERMMETREN